MIRNSTKINIVPQGDLYFGGFTRNLSVIGAKYLDRGTAGTGTAVINKHTQRSPQCLLKLRRSTEYWGQLPGKWTLTRRAVGSGIQDFIRIKNSWVLSPPGVGLCDTLAPRQRNERSMTELRKRGGGGGDPDSTDNISDKVRTAETVALLWDLALRTSFSGCCQSKYQPSYVYMCVCVCACVPVSSRAK